MNKIPYEERLEVYDDVLVKRRETTPLEVIKAISELVAEIARMEAAHFNYDNLPNVVDKMAKATIALEMYRHVYGINDDVCKAMDKYIEQMQKEAKNR